MKKIIIIFFISTFWSGIAISHDEEKYTGGGGYKITATNKYFVNIKDQKTLSFESKSDDIPGQFFI